LRGDAKFLFRKIKSKEEKRVKLIKTKTIEEQAEYLKDADLIIWSCGYQTNKILIKD
jgi:DNA-binding transcriptional regulator LsrR (DeoR family)